MNPTSTALAKHTNNAEHLGYIAAVTMYSFNSEACVEDIKEYVFDQVEIFFTANAPKSVYEQYSTQFMAAAAFTAQRVIDLMEKTKAPK